MATYTMLYGRVKEGGGNCVDEAILSYMKAPATYTREDVVEINCHSGPSIVRKVLELCIENGARTAEPGEFTKRAFLNGRIDIIQAEAVSELIAARSERAGQNALRKLEGQSSAEIEKIRRSLLEILMKIEAEIEFPDDIICHSPSAGLSLRKQGTIISRCKRGSYDEKLSSHNRFRHGMTSPAGVTEGTEQGVFTEELGEVQKLDIW